MTFDRQGIAHGICAPRYFMRDETIFRQGDRARGWYEVVEGMARVCQFRSDGRRQVLAFAVPGDIIGLEHGYRDSCAEALTPMLLSHHLLASGEAQANLPWDRVVRHNHQCLALIGLPTAIERVAAFILTMGYRLGARAQFDLPLSRADIADHLGLTMHTVSRTICDLARRGMVRVEAHHHFHLTDADALAAIAGIDPSEFHSNDQQLVA
jgi:CRP/FNR family transcriptional regulator, nitrogen fixation regulation protein